MAHIIELSIKQEYLVFSFFVIGLVEKAEYERS